MPPREDINAIRIEIDSWIEAYNNEKIEVKVNSDEIIDPNFEWNEMVKNTDELKQKYLFLSDFMKNPEKWSLFNQEIKFAEEVEYIIDGLDRISTIVNDEDCSAWMRYFIVNNKNEIVKVPYQVRDEDWSVLDNWFNGEVASNYIDENTKYIIKNYYSSYGNNDNTINIMRYKDNNDKKLLDNFDPFIWCPFDNSELKLVDEKDGLKIWDNVSFENQWIIEWTIH